MKDLQSIFENLGGKFISPVATIAEKMTKIKAFVFDWDGVFNDGTKQPESGSLFSEADAMGTNMLRFGYYLIHGKVPQTIIITGENNPSALTLSKRERFNALYSKCKNKAVALDHFTASSGLEPHQVCFFFDDILDLSLAEKVALNIQISHPAKPMFSMYLENNDLADYSTGNSGGYGGLRESIELLLAIQNLHDEVVSRRVAYEGKYKEYLALRQAQNTTLYTFKHDQIIQE